MRFLADMGISPNTVLAEHADVLAVGVVISVTEGRLRVRRLPIEEG